MPAALGSTAAVDGGGPDGVVGGTPKVIKGRGRDRRYRATTGGVVEEIIRLYSEGLSTRRTGDATGMDRQAVTRILHKAGVHLALRGAGRARPTARLPERAGLAAVLRDLYLLRRFTRAQIARELRIPESEVRTRLRSYGIRTRSRGWANREDRLQVDFDELEELYVERDLSADRVGEQMGTSQHMNWGFRFGSAASLRPATGPPGSN